MCIRDSSSTLKIHFIPIGNGTNGEKRGDAIFIECDGEYALIDAGLKGNNCNTYLNEFMKGKGLSKINLKCAVLTPVSYTHLDVYKRQGFISTILVAGGAGYIGSHTCVELLNAGYDVVVVDNLSNSSKESLNRVKQITGKDVKFYEADVADQPKMREIFEENKIFAVINFAGLKAVGESVEKPLELSLIHI